MNVNVYNTTNKVIVKSGQNTVTVQQPPNNQITVKDNGNNVVVQRNINKINITDKRGLPGVPGEDGKSFENQYETVSQNLKSRPYTFAYASGKLSTVTYDLGDGLSIVKTLNYTNGTLTSVVLSGDTPDGITLTKTLLYTNGTLTSIGYA